MARVRKGPDGMFVRIMPDGSTQPIEDRTDWARIDAMTEEEIEANALRDPDNPPFTHEELSRLRRVPNPREIRSCLNKQFAERFLLTLGTIRDWEQGKERPDSAARILHRVGRNP